MTRRQTDRDWDLLARTDPFWAVSTDDRYRRANLSDAALTQFFAAGEYHIDFLFRTIRHHLGDDFAPATALDFGCGVGRMLIPLARRCRAVTGVDVSEAMLTEARSRLGALGIGNVTLARGDDDLSAVPGRFDFVHSFIVLQHIPVERGVALHRRLLARLNETGVGAIHFHYAKAEHLLPPNSLLARARRLGGNLLRRVVPSRRKVEMQMNPYDLNLICRDLQQAGIRRLHVEFTDHLGCFGVLLLFRKLPGDGYRV